jgi:hypothetical protein
MRRRTRLIATTLALFGAAPAQAAKPIDLGLGSNPAAVVDPSGTAHIVFNSAGGQTYCRLPRNAPACDILTPLPLDQATGELRIFYRAGDRALLIVQGSTADASEAAHGTTWLRASVDGGATWQGPAPIGIGLTDLDDVALSNDGQSVLAIADDLDRLLFQLDPLTGTESRTINVNAKPDGTNAGTADDGAIVQTPQGRIVAAVDAIDDTRVRTFLGGDPFNQAAWLPFPPARVRGEGSPALAGGPRGTYLLNQRQVPAQRAPAAPFVIRSYDTRRNRWRAPKSAGADRLVFGGSTLVEDASGRLHLGWTSDAGHSSCVVYARTGTRSRSWFGRSTTLYRATVRSAIPVGLQIAAGADGRGVAVWGQEGSGANPPDGHVLVTALKQRRGRYRPIRNSYRRPYC